MIKNFDELVCKLKSKKEMIKIAVVAAHDEHTLEAIKKVTEDGLVNPILIGKKESIKAIAENIKFDLNMCEIISEDDENNCAKIAAKLAKENKVSAIMKGKIQTGALMKVMVNKEDGIKESDVMSIAGFFESPNYKKVFAITDPGLILYPDEETKYLEAINVVNAFKKLGVNNPKVAIITAVENVNPKMPETIDANKIKERGIEGAIIEGPISLDIAMDNEVAKIKNFEGKIAGDADILLFPDIVSANSVAKTLTVLGGARTGGVVIGAKVPILIVSRAASADDKFMSIVIGALIGRQQ